MVQHDTSALPLDGRVTEGVLKRWSVLVEEGHPDHESLHSALNALCARHGKKPNSLARISIIKEGREASASGFSDELVTLLAAVFRGLTPAQKSEFRRQIA
jgi:LmbE family N-acetylglucosaminyl deacetylase